MRLSIGITHLTPAWEILLKQIAPPFEILSPEIEWTPNNYSCIITSGRLDHFGVERLLSFVNMGGSILSETDAAEQLFNTRSTSYFINYINTENDSIFEAVSSGFIGCQLSVPNNATLTQDTHGKKLIEFKKVGQGQILVLPGGLVNSILSQAYTRRNFPTAGPWLPSERVSKVSKRTVRELVSQSLNKLVLKRELPFVSLSAFPDASNSIFIFRIDTDFASIEDVENMYRICSKHQIPATWFVETESCQTWLHRYADMTNQDVGLHCFKHRIAKKYADNEKNVRKGKSDLRINGINPKGYAAPFGEWNYSLNKALEHHGFEYSSEFSLDYDNLPFKPLLNERFSSMLQIPIHPISVGSLRNARHSTMEMVQYYNTVIDEHIISRLPIIFYDHPANTNLEVLDHVFKIIGDKNMSKLSMGDYSDWWKAREGITWEAKLKQGHLHLSTKNPKDRIQVNVFRDQKNCAIPLDNNVFDMNELTWVINQSMPLQVPHISVRSRLNHKMILNDILHNYWKYKL